MERKFLIPKKDVMVPKPRPSSGYLNPKGELVEMEIYWQRIINDGDAAIGNPPSTEIVDPPSTDSVA